MDGQPEKMKLLTALLLGLFFLVQELICHEIGEECKIGNDFGIVTVKSKCKIVTEFYAAKRLQDAKALRLGKKERNILFCCPERKAVHACRKFGKRPGTDGISFSSRLIGGTLAEQDEFPHFAALGYIDDGQLTFDCGGSLISENYVLTAAHCIDKDRMPVIVRMGRVRKI